MNLLDIVVTTKAEPKPFPHTIKEQMENAVADWAAWDRLNKRFPWERDIAKLGDGLKADANAKRASFLEVAGHLPNSALKLGERSDGLGLAAQSPVVALSEVRQLASDMKMVAMPFAYLPKTVVSDGGISVELFASLKEWFNLYVIAPPGHYDVGEHVRAEEDAPIFTGPELQQAFAAVSMVAPMLRSMHRDIELVRSQNEQQRKNLEDRMRNLERELGNLRLRASDLDRVASDARERQWNLPHEQMHWYAFLDPMLVAFPKRASIFGDEAALIGPCWGPDFPDSVAAHVGRVQIDGQRKAMEALYGYAVDLEKTWRYRQRSSWQSSVSLASPPTSWSYPR